MHIKKKRKGAKRLINISNYNRQIGQDYSENEVRKTGQETVVDKQEEGKSTEGLRENHEHGVLVEISKEAFDKMANKNFQEMMAEYKERELVE